MDLSPVDLAEPLRKPTEEEVLPDTKRRHEIDFLVDRADSQTLGFDRSLRCDWRTGQVDFAGIRLINAGQNLDQGGLPRSILAHQRVNFARPKFEVDSLKRFHPGKGFGEALGD